MQAEIYYNPYLQKTEIAFNQKKPGLNSRAEKLENKILTDWVDELPLIFEEEMNGYGFDLLFSGTKADAEIIRKVLETRKIDSRMVSFSSRHTVWDREKLLGFQRQIWLWLNKNPIPIFDPIQFMNENRSILNKRMEILFIGKKKLPDLYLYNRPVKVQKFIKCRNSEDQDLTGIPVLIELPDEWTRQNTESFSDLIWDLNPVLRNANKNQIFFLSKNSSNKSKTARMEARMLSELNFSPSQRVSSIYDFNLIRYLITHQVVQTIQAVNHLYTQLEKELTDSVRDEVKSKKSLIARIAADRTVNLKKIDSLRKSLQDMKEIRLDDLPASLREAAGEFLTRINEWNKRKQKVTGLSEGMSQAEEFNRFLNLTYLDFQQIFQSAAGKEQNRILEQFNEIYLSQKHQEQSEPVYLLSSNLLQFPDFPLSSEIFSSMGEERVARRGGDFLKQFMNTPQTNTADTEIETVFILDQWRDRAVLEMRKAVEQVSHSFLEIYRIQGERLLNLYEDRLNREIRYIEGLNNELDEQTARVETEISDLNNWIFEFSHELEKLGGDIYE